jgi:hypothetical protein
MIDIQEHRRVLAELLRPVAVPQGNRFGAWCCLALLVIPAASSFLEAQAGEREPVNAVVAELERAWDGADVSTEQLQTLRDIEWDPDEISMDQEAPAQLATDLLAALEHYLKWQSSRDVAALTACAECVVNAIDYLVDFELIDAAVTQPVLRELEAQKAFARELISGTIRKEDRLKYHEWLRDTR